jgi:putative transposase
MLCIRFPLSPRNVENIMHERGIGISHESMRFWWNPFGPIFAAEIRRRRIRGYAAVSSL